MSVNDGLSDEEWGAWGKTETAIQDNNFNHDQNGFGGNEEPSVSSVPEKSRFGSNDYNARPKYNDNKEQNGARFSDKRNGFGGNNDTTNRFSSKRDNNEFNNNGFKRDNDFKRNDNDQSSNRFRKEENDQQTSRFRNDQQTSRFRNDDNQKFNRFRNDENDQKSNRFRNEDNDQKTSRFRNADGDQKTNRFRNDDNDSRKDEKDHASNGRFRREYDEKTDKSYPNGNRRNGFGEKEYSDKERNEGYKKREDSRENRSMSIKRKDVYNRDDSWDTKNRNSGRDEYKRDNSRDKYNGSNQKIRNDAYKRDGSRENRNNFRRDDSEERNYKSFQRDDSRNRRGNSRDRNRDTKKNRLYRDDSSESDRPRRRNDSRDNGRRGDSPVRKLGHRQTRDDSQDRNTNYRQKRDDSREKKTDYRQKRDDSREKKTDYRQKRDDSRDRKTDFRQKRDDSRDRKTNFRQCRDDSRENKVNCRQRREDSRERKSNYRQNDDSPVRKTDYRSNQDDSKDRPISHRMKRDNSRDNETNDRQRRDDSWGGYDRRNVRDNSRDSTNRRRSPKNRTDNSDNERNKNWKNNNQDNNRNRDTDELRNNFDRKMDIGNDDNSRFQTRSFSRSNNDKPDDDNAPSGGDLDNAPQAAKRVTFVPDDDLADYALHVNSGINFDNYDKIPVEVTGENAPLAIAQFSDLKEMPEFLLKNISDLNYKKLTPVQKYAIPIISERRDLMSCAQTGSGKTAAFLIPIIADLIRCEKDTDETITNSQVGFPKALILAPTRELCRQIFTAAKQLCEGSGIRCSYLYGGIEMNKSRRNMHANGGGCDILVATPGRLIHFLELVWVSLRSLRFFVLDEADRMLEAEGFYETVSKIYRESNIAGDESRTIQISMFSATFPHEIQELARTLLRTDYLFLAVGVVGAASSDVRQEIVLSEQSRDKITSAIDYIKTVPEEKTLVFVDTKRMADFLGIKLGFLGFKTTTIHGDREQEQREQALNDFKSGRVNLMVATNVAARGLDIPMVDNVINLDLPGDIDTYVHRIGRTGRCGNVGRAISFFDESKDIGLASGLVAKLQESNQEVADWLRALSDSGAGAGASNGRRQNYSSRDTRRDVASSRFVDTPGRTDFMQGSNLDYDDSTKPDSEWLED